MDPGTGRIYSQSEMDRMTEEAKAKLIRLEGRREDIERISQAVQDMNRAERRAAGHRGPKQ